MNDDTEIHMALRDRSRRFVMTLFAAFAILFASLALTAHHAPDLFTLPADDMPRIAAAFLFLASAYTMTMFVWDLLFPMDDI